MLRTRLTLKPGRSGTRDLVEQYDRSWSVSATATTTRLGIRYKTVELIVDEKPWTPPPPITGRRTSSTSASNPTNTVSATPSNYSAVDTNAIRTPG